MLCAIDKMKTANPNNHELLGLPKSMDRESAIKNIDDVISDFYKKSYFTPENGALLVWVDEKAGKVLGMTGYSISEQADGFDLVHPDHRGGGLGKQLLAARLEHMAERDDIKSVMLKVSPENIPSVKRIEKLVAAGLAVSDPYNLHSDRMHYYHVDVQTPQAWGAALGNAPASDKMSDLQNSFGASSLGETIAPQERTLEFAASLPAHTMG